MPAKNYAATAVGRYKGGGRWIEAWVHFQDPERKPGKGDGFFCTSDARKIGPVEISDAFSRRLAVLAKCCFDEYLED